MCRCACGWERGDAWTLLVAANEHSNQSGFVQHNVVLVLSCLRRRQDHAARCDVP